MKKPRSRILDFLVYFLVRSLGCVLQALPPEWALTAVRLLARLAYRLDHRHRKVAIENLRIAFPGRYSEEELQRLAFDVYEHYAKMLLELLLIPRALGSRHFREKANAAKTPELRAIQYSGRPILIVTAHYGNWELAAFVLRAAGVQSCVVARPLDNPFLDDLVRRFRESTGNKVLSKHGELGRMLDVLEARGALCTLADQDAGERGIFVDFFGRPASTHKAFAYMARRTRAYIVVIGLQSMKDLLDYEIRVTDIIDPDEYAEVKDCTFAITQRITKGIEKLVLHDPRQYFWLHNRWKRQPPARKAAAAAA